MWGVDFILRDGKPHVVEVNPRYTSAFEVIELAGASVVGKAIYFAPHPIRFPASGPWDAGFARPFDPWRVPAFADIPDPGSEIEPGHPVLTVFATGDAPTAVRAALQSRAAELDSLFAEDSP